MYADTRANQGTTLYQGDIIADFPFFLFQSGLPIRRTETGLFELSDENPDGNNHIFAVEARKQQIIILSQTCDVQRRANVIICPVYDLKEFISDNTINVERARSIRKRGVNYWFYLPAYSDLVESIADMQTMIYVPRTEIEQYLTKRVVSLNDLGRHHLAWSLATYFGRPAEE
jgi:hypothetical protein